MEQVWSFGTNKNLTFSVSLAKFSCPWQCGNAFWFAFARLNLYWNPYSNAAFGNQKTTFLSVIYLSIVSINSEYPYSYNNIDAIVSYTGCCRPALSVSQEVSMPETLFQVAAISPCTESLQPLLSKLPRAPSATFHPTPTHPHKFKFKSKFKLLQTNKIKFKCEFEKTFPLFAAQTFSVSRCKNSW